MPAALALSGEQHDLVAAYATWRAEEGLAPGREKLAGAKRFGARVGDPADWTALSLEQQLALPVRVRTFVGWLLLTGRTTATADYLVAARHELGRQAIRHHRDFHQAFIQAAAGLGFAPGTAVTQWSSLVHVAVLYGVAPERVSAAMLTQGRGELEAAIRRHRDSPERYPVLTKTLFGVASKLFHLGVIDTPPSVKHGRDTARIQRREDEWARIAPGLAVTMRAYLDQTGLVQRPATVTRNESALRELGCFLAEHAPEVACIADIRRPHLEAYKTWLAARPLKRGEGTLDRASIRNRISALRGFFDRLLEWGHDDAPAAPLLFAGDLPITDRPLPRFLDDAAAARLLQAARNHPDAFVRLVVELLARTGMRKSELVNLTVDAVVQIGRVFWLRIPVGKLHNDRYIPLHPQLKALLDDWIAIRPPGVRSDLLFVDRGRAIASGRVDAALREVAAAAGIGHVTPHQLRHTLGTQAINRGMSLEAIAALFGHKTLSMTMVYARIADRTVADEYFAVTAKVEALYDQPHELPADAEGAKMAKLRREMHERLLGNGYCARPPELDCQFESICEACTFFRTTVEFLPILKRQRDDAAAKGQHGRHELFDGLVARLAEDAS